MTELDKYLKDTESLLNQPIGESWERSDKIDRMHESMKVLLEMLDHVVKYTEFCDETKSSLESLIPSEGE